MKKKLTFFSLAIFFLVLFAPDNNAQTNIPNADFEDWETREIVVISSGDTVDYAHPSHWISASDMIKVGLGVKASIGKSIDSQSGDYALDVCLASGIPMVEVVNVFGVNSNPNKLRGYYKFATMSSDTITIGVTAIGGSNNEVIGSGEILITERAGDYKDFSLDINYSSQNNADSLVISIVVKGNGLLPLCSTFDNFSLDYSSSTQNIPAQESIAVGPNPFGNSLNIKNQYKNSIDFKLYDITGKVLKTQNIKGLKSFNFDTSNLQPGLYLAKFEYKNGTVTTKKFIKQSIVN